ncbi:MAG: hypothetical protein ACJ8CR_13840 [Roseiflexaceae bacterium]
MQHVVCCCVNQKVVIRNTRYAIGCTSIAEPMTETETLLQQGIAAAQAGRREEARALLMQVVQTDERNEQGWLWLAGVVDDPDDMRTCLDNVLDLNPGNTKAQQGLAWIDSHYGPRAVPTPTPQPVVAPMEPQERASYTGPTARLVPEVAPADPIPAPSPSQPAPQSQLSPAEAPAPVANPCPYCGAPTILSQKTCTQCRNSLMIRTTPREKRSVSTTIMSALYGLNGAPSIGLGLFIIIFGLINILSSGSRGSSPGLSILSILLLALIIVIPGILNWLMAWGLFMRRRWAYIITAIFVGISALVVLVMLIFGAMLIADMMQNPRVRLPSGTNRAILTNQVFQLVLVLIFAFFSVLLPLILLIMSYHDFFSRRVRFAPEVELADSMGHYNNGVAYKNRGMWYMATREWEAAVSKAPRDMHYLHALGLAYAQIKKLYPQSTANLQSVRHLLLSRKAELYERAPELERLNLL